MNQDVQKRIAELEKRVQALEAAIAPEMANTPNTVRRALLTFRAPKINAKLITRPAEADRES